MLICELLRTLDFTSGLTPYSLYVFKGYTKRYQLRDSWGSSCDDLFTESTRVKVKQATRDYLNSYLEALSLNDCIDQEGSYYFDRTEQSVYIHVEHNTHPSYQSFDYGYAFGLCGKENDVTYIDDYEYLPLVTTMPDVEQEDETIGQGKPTGITGVLLLDNESVMSTETGKPEGVFDYLLTESIYGNDVLLYDYENGNLNPVCAFYVESLEISQEECSLELQSRRFS